MKKFLLIMVFIFSGIIYSQDFWQRTNGPWSSVETLFPRKSGVVLAGSAGGYYRSTNNGNDWQKYSTTKYTGVFNSDPSGNYLYIYSGTRIIRSSDDGISWDSLAIMPKGFMVFDSQGKIYYYYQDGTSAYFGFTSSDGGYTFSPASITVPTGVTYVYYFAINMKGDMFLVGTSAGSNYIYRSTNGGVNWVKLINGIQLVSGYFTSLKIKQDGTLFVTSNTAGIFRSTDNGNSWAQTNYGLWDSNVTSFEIMGRDTLLAGTKTAGMFYSTDNGTTWVETSSALLNVSINYFAVTGSGEILAATPKGVYRTSDLGTSWNISTKGISSGTIDAITVDKNGDVYCAGEYQGIFRSTDRGENWVKVNDSLADNLTSYLGFTASGAFYRIYNLMFFKSVDKGVSWKQIVYYGGNNCLISKDNTIYLFRTTNFDYSYSKDEGSTWQDVATPLPIVGSLNINPVTGSYFIGVGYNQINGKPSIGYSSDGGNTWTIRSNGIYLYPDVLSIVFNSKGHIFILTNDSSKVYRSTDDGLNWVKVFTGSSIKFQSLLIDSNDRIYGGGTGILVSEDNGDSWRTMISGIPVKSMAMSDDGYIYLGTNGNGVYRTTTSTVGVKDRVTQLQNYSLSQNYPNPFNPNTTISYSIPERGNVKLTVYNSLGQVISELVNEEKPAGNFSVQFNAANLPSGVYFYQIKSGNFNSTKKLILIK